MNLTAITEPEDVARLSEIGADAALVGEALMRAEDKKRALSKLRGKTN